jgi:hypothetical protein
MTNVIAREYFGIKRAVDKFKLEQFIAGDCVNICKISIDISIGHKIYCISVSQYGGGYLVMV